MDTVNVVDVMDGNTIAVSPPWRFGMQQGHLVRIRGMRPHDMSASQGRIARCKLTLTLLGTRIQIAPTGAIEGHALVCDVMYQGHPLQTHFVEYAER